MVGCLVSEIHFGHPSLGRFTFNAVSTASSHLPSIFNRSGSGPLSVRRASSGFRSLVLIILSGFFFINQISFVVSLDDFKSAFCKQLFVFWNNPAALFGGN